MFFSFTAELKYLNEGTYDFLAISKYITLNLPKSITIMFPYAMLIGAMLSLGAMASDHEFVAMQSAGISVSKIISLILIQSFLISSFSIQFQISSFQNLAVWLRQIRIWH